MFHKFYMLILCALNIQHGQRCVLNTRIHFGEPLPVILRNNQILEPDDNDGNIVLNAGDVLILSCQGAGFINHPDIKDRREVATISCEGGDNFRNDDWLTSLARFTFFRCSFSPIHHSRPTNRTCYEGYPLIDVGYTIGDQFYPVYESCFDDVHFNPIYSKYTQKPYNAFYQTRVERPFFLDNHNYENIPVERLFSPPGQKAAVAQRVGPLVESYVTKSQLLSRGHLAAKTDFVFAFTERATFHYVNCAPQWTGFNGGNWNTLEVDLRNHIHAAGYETIIYTGTFGITQLSDNFGRRVDLHLYTDQNNNPVIPIPQYFYKVVYEPRSKRGIAYVGINNPYYTFAEAQELFFCSDICRNTSGFGWLSWHPDNPAEGYTFCCSIPDFKDTVHHLPYFEVGGLLI
ncbi:uncharacterized protein LOC123709871 [Pieris brassicae]|nr:uncharacterized protein LOC123709871 [Pieris brassicae]